MSSPWPTVGLCLLYYYIIRVAGPNYMKNREPFNIQNIVVFYNLFQTIFSIWIFAKATKFWFTGVICYIKWVLPSKYIIFYCLGKYNWLCQPVDYSYTQDGFDAADMTWWYYFSKFVDFFDSFLFLARKKFSHLSTLHVVHHGIMPLTSWFGIRYAINCSYGEGFKKWWKIHTYELSKKLLQLWSSSQIRDYIKGISSFFFETFHQ